MNHDRPDIYLSSIRDAAALLMSSSTEYLFVLGNREKILTYDVAKDASSTSV